MALRLSGWSGGCLIEGGTCTDDVVSILRPEDSANEARVHYSGSGQIAPAKGQISQSMGQKAPATGTQDH